MPADHTPTTPPLPAPRDLGAELVARGDGWHVSPELMPSTAPASPAVDGQITTPTIAAWADLLTTAQHDRDQALSMLTDIGDAISPTGERPAEALGTLVADVEALADRCDRTEEERDQARAERDEARTTADEMTRAVKRLVPELAQQVALNATAERDLDRARVELEAARGQARHLRQRVEEAHTTIRALSWDILPSIAAAPVPAPGAPEPDGVLADRIAQAIGDPGSVVGPRRLRWRDGDDVDGEHETVTRWATRAVMAVLAETAAAPAVDHADGPEGPAEGQRTDEAGPEAQGDAEAPWEHTDRDGDTITVRPTRHGALATIVNFGPNNDSPAIGTTIDLDPDAAADLHAWLGQQLGASAPSTPDGTPIEQMLDQHRADYGQAENDTERAAILGDLLADWYQAWPPSAATDPHEPIAQEILRIVGTPPPGPQDIPEAWALALLRTANAEQALDIPDAELPGDPRAEGYRQAIRSAYRLGYAACNGNEITVEDDLVLIGDRTQPTAGLEPDGNTEATPA